MTAIDNQEEVFLYGHYFVWYYRNCFWYVEDFNYVLDLLSLCFPFG